MPKDDLISLFSGATAKWESPNGRPGKSLFKPDGTMSGEVEGSTSMFYDDGKWWVKDPNLICTKWRTWREGRTVCSRYVKVRWLVQTIPRRRFGGCNPTHIDITVDPGSGHYAVKRDCEQG